MTDPWMDAFTLVMISAMNGSSVAENLLHSTIVTWNMFYDGSMDGWMLFGHECAMKASSVAEYMLPSFIATCNMFYDESMDGCVLFGYDICTKWV